MHVIALGHDKKMFSQDSRPFARQRAYAQWLTSLHVFIPSSEHESRIEFDTLTIHPVVGTNPVILVWRIVQALYTQIRISQTTAPTVLIVQSPFEFGLLGLCLSYVTKVPLQVQVHGDFYSRPYWRTESWSNRVRARVGLFVLRRASGIRVVSKRIAASLQERGVPVERITVLPIEADVQDFVSAIPKPIWPVRPGVITVLSVGRFAREKNFPLLIQAFYTVHQQHPQTQLVLVGEGSEELKLRSLVASLWPVSAPVLFCPWQHDIAAVMKAADIYALSSDHEGYAMVLGEAMACGVPVVTTDVGCSGELLESNRHGLVVPPRDTESYVEALSRLVTDARLRTSLGAAGVARIRQLEQSTDVYTKSLVATWQSLV